jgi:hypothetical protein
MTCAPPPRPPRSGGASSRPVEPSRQPAAENPERARGNGLPCALSVHRGADASEKRTLLLFAPQVHDEVRKTEDGVLRVRQLRNPVTSTRTRPVSSRWCSPRRCSCCTAGSNPTAFRPRCRRDRPSCIRTSRDTCRCSSRSTGQCCTPSARSHAPSPCPLLGSLHAWQSSRRAVRPDSDVAFSWCLCGREGVSDGPNECPPPYLPLFQAGGYFGWIRDAGKQ